MLTEHSTCKHEKTLPPFDHEKAAKMSVSEIHKHFPRFDGPCPDCGAHVVSYASFEHYIMGDW